MRPTRARTALAVLAASLVAATSAWAQGGGQDVSVEVDRSQIATGLGEKFSFRSTVTNGGSSPLVGQVAHLNVLSLKEGTYVDPEDWSSNRTRYLDPIPAGGSVTINWQMQAVNDGEFGVYVSVLPETGEAVPPVTAPTIHLDVAARRSLNPSGMVPVALGIPILLGLLAFAVRLSRRG